MINCILQRIYELQSLQCVGFQVISIPKRAREGRIIQGFCKEVRHGGGGGGGDKQTDRDTETEIQRDRKS